METIKSKGFGDTVDKFTSATGIKGVIKAIAPNCGCEKRKEFLNKIIPYGSPK